MTSCKEQVLSGDILNLKSVSFSSEAPKESSFVQRGLIYVRENALAILWTTLWLSANFTIFSIIYERYYSSEFFPLLGYGICFARSTGYLLMFNLPLCVLMMCRWLFTIGEKWGLGHLFPFSRHVVAHKILGWTTLPLTCVHVSAHYYNAYRISIAEPELFFRVLGNKFTEQPTLFGYLYMTLPGITGHIAFVFLLCMYAFARDSIRVKHFEKFSIIHRSYMIVNFALMLHGRLEIFESSKFIIFFSIPGTIYSIERFLRMVRGTKRRIVLEGTITKKNTIHLRVERQNLTYYPGQWGYVNFPGISALQWHPFSIVSHPEDPYLAFDIRPIGDWTNGLLNLLVTGPEQQAKAKKIWMKFDGPFGASTLKALEKDVTVLVVSGIGVTRFMSLIRQLKIIMLSAAFDATYRRFSTASPFSAASDHQSIPVPMDVAVSASLSRKKKGLRVPKKIYLFWVYREKSFPEDFSWFLRDLQHEAVKDILEVHTFWAGAPAHEHDAHNFEIFPVPTPMVTSGVASTILLSPTALSPPLLSPQRRDVSSPPRQLVTLSPSFQPVLGPRVSPDDKIDVSSYLPSTNQRVASPEGHSMSPSESRAAPAEGLIMNDNLANDTNNTNDGNNAVGYATSDRHVAETQLVHRRPVSRTSHVTDEQELVAKSDQLDALLECAGDREIMLSRVQSRDHLTRVQSRDHLSRAESRDHLSRVQSPDHLSRVQSPDHLSRAQSRDHLDKGSNASQSDLKTRFVSATLKRSFRRVMGLGAVSSPSPGALSPSSVLDFRDLMGRDVDVTTKAPTEVAPRDVTRPAWLGSSMRMSRGAHVSFLRRPTAPVENMDGDDVTSVALAHGAEQDVMDDEGEMSGSIDVKSRASAYLVMSRKPPVAPTRSESESESAPRRPPVPNNWVRPVQDALDAEDSPRDSDSDLEAASPLKLCEDKQRVTSSNQTALEKRPLDVTCDDTVSHVTPIPLPHLSSSDVTQSSSRPMSFGPGFAAAIQSVSRNGHVAAGHVGDGHVAVGHVVDGHVAVGHVGDGHVAVGHVGDGHVGDTWGDNIAPTKSTDGDITGPVTNIRHWAGKPNWPALFAQIQSAHVIATEPASSHSRSRAASLAAPLQRLRSTVSMRVRKKSRVTPVSSAALVHGANSQPPTSDRPVCPSHDPACHPYSDSEERIPPEHPTTCSPTSPERCSDYGSGSGWDRPGQEALLAKNSNSCRSLVLDQQPAPANHGFRQIGVYCSGTLWLHRDVTEVCRELNAKRQAGWPEFLLEKSD